jgi:hypothetical protein
VVIGPEDPSAIDGDHLIDPVPKDKAAIKYGNLALGKRLKSAI